MALEFALQGYGCHEILGVWCQLFTQYLLCCILEMTRGVAGEGQLTHVLAKVLNLNSLSRPSPSAVSVQRPPLVVRSGAREGARAAGSEPAGKRGCGLLVIVAVPVVAVVRGRMVGRGGCGWRREVMGAKKLVALGHTRCVTRENCLVDCFWR